MEGPVAIKVVYPPANSAIPAVDSTFIFGTVGNGQASLTINGTRAQVYPNGAFMGWVKTPPASRATYELAAVVGSDTTRLAYPLHVPTPPTPLPLTGRLVVDSADLTPRPTLVLRDEELATVRLRAPANVTATLHAANDTAIALTRIGEVATYSKAVPARLLRNGGTVIVARGRDTVHAHVAPVEAVLDDHPHVVHLGKGVTLSDSDAMIYGRPLPNDTYKWFLLPGTAVQLTGRNGSGYSRVRLDSQLEVWIVDADIDDPAPSSPPFPAPALRTTSNARVRSSSESADLVIPITAQPAFFVEQYPDRIELTLYDTRGNTDIIGMPTADSLIRHVTWEQLSPDRVRVTLHLGARPLGYLALFERGTFILRVRRAPHVDPSQPLRGLTIALDAGHPPAGATGPTTLYEGQATLWVAERAKQMLEDRGATVVMTRTTMDPLELAPRRVISRRANADAFVSIHLNAYADGVNPFTAGNGTGTYFYRTAAEPLARAVQQGLLSQMGLHDEGIFFRSLAVTVQTWMPAILCEGAFVIIPEQEAALRTPEFQTRYAQGIVNGLEAYFRELGR